MLYRVIYFYTIFSFDNFKISNIKSGLSSSVGYAFAAAFRLHTTTSSFKIKRRYLGVSFSIPLTKISLKRLFNGSIMLDFSAAGSLVYKLI